MQAKNLLSVRDEQDDGEGGNGNDNLLDGMGSSYSSFTHSVGKNQAGKRWSVAQERAGSGGTLSDNSSNNSRRSSRSTEETPPTRTSSGEYIPVNGAEDDSTDGRWNGVPQELGTESRRTPGNNGYGSQSLIPSTTSSNTSISSPSVVDPMGRTGGAGDRMDHTETTPMLSGGGTQVMTTTAGNTQTQAITGSRYQVRTLAVVQWAGG